MKILSVIITVVLFSVGAFAHGMKTELTAEQRKEKIQMHEKMAEHHKMEADCLKAGKSLDECNDEAMKDCPMMGKDCPFMNKGQKEKEMMREHMKKMKQSKTTED